MGFIPGGSERRATVQAWTLWHRHCTLTLIAQQERLCPPVVVFTNPAAAERKGHTTVLPAHTARTCCRKRPAP